MVRIEGIVKLIKHNDTFAWFLHPDRKSGLTKRKMQTDGQEYVVVSGYNYRLR